MADASVGFVNNPDDVPFASQAEEDAWEAAHPIVVRRGAGPTGAPALGGSVGQAIPPSGADLSKLKGAMGAPAPNITPPPFQWDGKGDPFADLPPAAPAPSAATAPNAAASWNGKSDPFADLDRSVPVQQAADKAKLATPSSLVGQIGSGLSQGAIDILGLPGDLITGAGNLVSRGINAATGSHIPIVTSPIGSEAIGSAFGAINPRMNPANVPPQNTAEALARGIGAGAASALVPEMAVSGVAPLISGAAPRVAEALPAAFGSGSSNAALAKNAAIGAGAGLAGEGAAAASPDAVRPYARLAGNLVGGAAGGLLAEAPGAAGAAVRAGREYAQPFTAGGQSAAADAIFANKIVQDRAAALEALRNYQGSAIPGAGAEAAPTTFQATGDMGIGAGERAFETANPIPFQQRRTAQNNARVAVLERLQPTGDPGQVAAHIQAQLADLDDMTNGIVGQATKRAQAAGAAIPEVAPEESGAAMRRGLVETNKGAKAWERALWSAVDPDGSLAMGTAPIANGARRIASETASTAKPIEGEEAAIFKAAQSLSPVSKFSEVTALRSRISDEMRALRNAGEAESQSFRRLTQLRGEVEQAIIGAAEHKAAQESEAVAAGKMKPEDTMAARWQAEADAFQRARAEAARGNPGGDNQANSRGEPPRIPGARGAKVQAAERSGNAAGAPGLSPNIDENAAERIKLASAATAERKQTFGQGPVGEALRTQGSADNFKVLDSAVGQKFFKPGMTGAEAARAFREATGNSPDAMAGLANYAALTLRKAAMRPDGTLDPKAFETWRGKYGEALKEFPGLAGSFANAAKAAEAVDAATAMRSAALKAYEQGAVGKVLKVSDPEAVTNTVGAIFGEKNAIQQMRQLASEVASNPAARDGLRRAVAKFMAEKFISNREAGTSGVNALKGDAFQTFVRKNRSALAQVLKPDEIKGLEAVAKSLAEANRSIDALKLPGRSNTPQDLASAALAKIKPPENKSPISLFTEMIAAGEVGAHVGGHVGMIAGAGLSMGRHMLGAVRAAGMKNVRDLVEEMILNPELARAALERAPVEKTTTRDIKFRQQLNRIATIAASRMISQKQQGQR